MEAIIEQAMTGSMLRVTLLPGLQPATVMVAGVQCPTMGKRPAIGPGGDASAVEGQQAQQQPEPFAREAKWYAEARVLNRECRLVVEGVSQVRGVATIYLSIKSSPPFPGLALQTFILTLS